LPPKDKGRANQFAPERVQVLELSDEWRSKRGTRTSLHKTLAREVGTANRRGTLDSLAWGETSERKKKKGWGWNREGGGQAAKKRPVLVLAA